MRTSPVRRRGSSTAAVLACGCAFGAPHRAGTALAADSVLKRTPSAFPRSSTRAERFFSRLSARCSRVSREISVLRAEARGAKLRTSVKKVGDEKHPRGAKRRCTYRPGEGGEGVLVGAFQSEREEETRDRAERGSVVRGSDQASVAPERIPSPTKCRDASRSGALATGPTNRLL
jgi:hypothetical protein